MKKTTFFIALLLILLASINSFSQKQKIIYDCDFGGDIDDAYGLALLLSSPEVDLVGVVLDNGNTPKRAECVCRFLYETGREDIPVAVGRKTSDRIKNQFHWGDGFTKYKPVKQSGPDFIIEKLRKSPNKIILLTVGPVTNMADIIDKDPGALKLAKSIYSMFGSFYVGYGTSNPIPVAESNVRKDVEASKKFTSAGVNIIYGGLEVTNFKLGEEYRNRISLRNSPLTNSLDALYTLWRYEGYARPDANLFDAITIGMVLWPELFKTRPAHVKVIGDGYTVIDESKEPNGEIGMSVNQDEFLKRFTERLLKQNIMRN